MQEKIVKKSPITFVWKIFVFLSRQKNKKKKNCAEILNLLKYELIKPNIPITEKGLSHSL